jgi:sulfur carrier protein
VTLQINGEPVSFPVPAAAPWTVRAVLEHLGLADAVVAVAVDGAFVPRGEHATLILADGASVEIVAPMQGG